MEINIRSEVSARKSEQFVAKKNRGKEKQAGQGIFARCTISYKMFKNVFRRGNQINENIW